MDTMLTELCMYLHNWFESARYISNFTVSDGVIDLSELETDGSIQNGQYFRIIGSVFNDGVYQYPASDLTDETFSGAVVAMAVPQAVLDLCDEIEDWIDTVGSSDAVQSPFSSESFGGYSYTKAGSGGTGDSADGSTWMGHFKGKLARYRKI